MMATLFWISALFIGYTYLGYPLWLFIQKKISVKPVQKVLYEPTVSVVIAARNEEQAILRRLENLLGQTYPPEKLQIIVVSDGSTDRTVEAVRQLSENRVMVIPLATNQGKAVALNTGINAAQGEIIVFADARQRFEADVVAQLVNNFNDRSVGCVSGELILLQHKESDIKAEMGAYWKYEKWIRKAESATGSVVGATGAIYAIRRELYRPLPQGTLLDDVLTPMNIVMQGKRCIFDATALAYDKASKDATQEWARKVRTLAGNWQLLSLCPKLALPSLNPLWWRFMSHKIFRLLVPFALACMLISGALVGGWLYAAATLVQVLCYTAAMTGLLIPATRSVRLINFSYFFLVMNGAAVAGLWRWLTGRCDTAWNVQKA